MKKKIVYILFLLLSVHCFSQSSLYRLKNITTVNGLSQSSVIAIHQDLQGQMWFGSWQGLCIYDGKIITNAKDKESWTK